MGLHGLLQGVIYLSFLQHACIEDVKEFVLEEMRHRSWNNMKLGHYKKCATEAGII
jgi:hypothetical protein